MRSTSPGQPTALSIGELSRRTGVNIETIRYYERINMLPAPPRTGGGRRAYGSGDGGSLLLSVVPVSSGSR
jgi:MerR family transcriptional regulator, mercuric resistance operon regulatory protein